MLQTEKINMGINKFVIALSDCAKMLPFLKLRIAKKTKLRIKIMLTIIAGQII